MLFHLSLRFGTVTEYVLIIATSLTRTIATAHVVLRKRVINIWFAALVNITSALIGEIITALK
jgi:hypothetical protein